MKKTIFKSIISIFIGLFLTSVIVSCDTKNHSRDVKVQVFQGFDNDDDNNIDPVIYWYLISSNSGSNYYYYSSPIPVTNFNNVNWTSSNTLPVGLNPDELKEIEQQEVNLEELPEDIQSEIEDNLGDYETEVDGDYETEVDGDYETESDTESDGDFGGDDGGFDGGDSGGDGGGE